MKASIIIPTYERPSFLRQALESASAVRSPTGGYQVIVINDGGAGVNRNLVRKWWTGPQERLAYARIAHAGLGAAVNRGLALAVGRYCTILPDDDTILPNKLEVMCSFLDAHRDAPVAYSLPAYFDANGSPLQAPPILRRFLLSHPVVTWEHVQRGEGPMIHGTSFMYRRDVCLEAGGWDTNLATGEEWEFHLRLLKLGYSFHAVDAVTTGYRVHDGCKSNRFRKDRSSMRRYIRDKLGQIRR